MKRTRHTTDQIIQKLRQADVALGKDEKVPDICKQLQISEQTYYRWRQGHRREALVAAPSSVVTDGGLSVTSSVTSGVPVVVSPVHPRGLEPLTFGSVDRCSIQLS